MVFLVYRLQIWTERRLTKKALAQGICHGGGGRIFCPSLNKIRNIQYNNELYGLFGWELITPGAGRKLPFIENSAGFFEIEQDMSSAVG
jgi:hypothetical protein